jgi:hypothetical protein
MWLKAKNPGGCRGFFTLRAQSYGIVTITRFEHRVLAVSQTQ